ncbi:transglycosylase domain-containing protein [Nocardiopsis sp. CNT-189]|uniref:transglycosylase domain-containing protein n=1 Tax=Nocardiopsis oceanisediminis TaxID=2816862 RepID=UPI003B3B4AA2
MVETSESDSSEKDSASAEESQDAGQESLSAFKDSGSFFRDRVAQTLAEQGYDLRKDGTWGADPEDGEAGAEQGSADTAEAPGDAGAERTEAGAPVSADSGDSGDFGDPDGGDGASAGEQSASQAQGAAEEDRPAGGKAEDSADEGPATAAFAPVFDDGEDGDGAAERGAASEAGAGETGGAGASSEAGDATGTGAEGPATAAFAPVFDDGDEDGDDDGGESAAPQEKAGERPADADAAAEGPATAEFAPVFRDEDGGDGDGAAERGAGAGSADAGEAGADTPSESEDATAALPSAAAGDGARQGGEQPEGARPGFAAPAAAGAAAGSAAGSVPPAAPASAAAAEGSVSGARNILRAKRPGKAFGGKKGKDGNEGTALAGARTGGPGGPKGPGKKGKKGGGPKKPLWFRIVRASLIALLVMLGLGAAGFAIAYAVFEVPTSAKAEATDQGSVFYYSDGKTKFAERGVDRERVDYEQIPEEVQEAVISAEDRGFWEEPGVSLTGTLRAAFSTFTGQQVQGGSTITQQMVRNYYEGVSKDQTISRKLQEIIIALKVDQSKDKQWVMEQYLNSIYFGRQAYGIQAAAQAYYHKDVGELNVAESAFLAAAIQQPTKFGMADSDTTPEMETRWRYVVNGMVEEELITKKEADELEFPKPEKETPGEGLGGFTGYMWQQAMSEMDRLGYSEDNVNRGGYKIVTSFDKDLMEAAKAAVEDNVDVDNLPEGVQAGLTAIDPATGEVVAFYGGKDFNENQYDSAFRGAAQSGSAFKPYVLAAALESGKSLNTVVDGSNGQTFNGSVVNNADRSGGPMNLIEATRRSSNTGYINLALETGLDNVVDMAHAAGIPEDKITEEQAAAPTLALGVSDVSAVDQASGYATFANGGMHIEPHVIREIVNQDGENEREKPKETRAMEEGVANDVTYALERVVSSGTGRSANLPDGRPVAGKTGTTDSSVAAWFAGYTPQMSTAVGVYNGNNQPFSMPGYGSLSGGTLPATIWRSFMAKAMEGVDPESFPGPSYGGETENFAPDVPAEDPATQPPDDGLGEVPPEEEPPPVPENPEVPEQPEVPEEPEGPGTPEEPGTGGPGIPENPGDGEPPPPTGG